MRTVAIFKNSHNQAIRIPQDMAFHGVLKLEIRKDGDTLILRPVRPSWRTLQNLQLADDDFLAERQDVVEENRFDLTEHSQ